MQRGRDWTEQHILGLPVQEYDDIEFKAPAWLNISTPTDKNKTRNDLAVELGALANTGGGKLVIGIRDPKACKSGKLEIVDGGVPLIMDKTDTAEWLNSTIPTLLDVELKGFDVHPIRTGGSNSQIDPDKALFVIDVPDSEAVPHQCKHDKKYYMRMGGNAHPVGHRLVLDMLGRRHHPKVELNFEIEVERRPRVPLPVELDGAPIEISIQNDTFVLIITARNAGRIYAQYLNAIVLIPFEIFSARGKHEKNEKMIEEGGYLYYEHFLENTRRDLMSREPMEPPNASGMYKRAPVLIERYGPSWFNPILPGRSLEWRVEIRHDFEDHLSLLTAEVGLLWATYADNAPPESGTIGLRDITIIEKKEGR